MTALTEYDLTLARGYTIDHHTLPIDDLSEIVDALTDIDLNREIGINPKFLPTCILPVIVTGNGKGLILRPEIGYLGPEVDPLDSRPGWGIIWTRLSPDERELYINNLMLGSGTAWDGGLYVGQNYYTEWKNIIEFLSDFAVDNPNYPIGQSPNKLIPSIILPPPSLRRTLAWINGAQFDTQLEMRIFRRHEESHVIEMLLRPWPENGDTYEGLPPQNGAATFFTMLNNYQISITDQELTSLLSKIQLPGIMPRGYVGELQAYIGDIIYYSRYFSGTDNVNFRQQIDSDLIMAKELLFRRNNSRNYFGALMAKTIVEQIGLVGSIQFLNEIYERMSVPSVT